MKMPASGGDLVSTTLRLTFSPGAKVGELDCGVEASAKRVLLSRIEYESAANYQSSRLNTLKSKYIVINTKNTLTNAKTANGISVNNKKSGNVTLPVPKLTLFPPGRVQLGYRGNLSVGSGMSNMGNTCYLNSTLQALFHVPALVNWLVSETAHQKCEQNSDYQMHPDDITCSVIKTFKCSQQKTGNCMKPISVYSKLKAICKHLSHGSQEDAHEFMRYLLESMEKNYLTQFQGHKLDSSSKETTPINQIFGGYIRTEVTCLSCKAVSTTFQHFQDLPLDIRKASTLDDALAGYFERERLPEGDDAYKCEKCNRKVPATKKFTIEKPPNVLCVQLKRFSMTNGKITKQVQLPLNLDVTRFVSPSVQPRHPVKYRLVSMVTHMGQSANCGHYTAIALAANGFYYQFDDSSVRQIPPSTVHNMSAYLVLYEIERHFMPPSPRPFPASSTVTWSSNEQPEFWMTPEIPVLVDIETKREGTGPQSRAAKLGILSAPPASPSHSSLVPYESDVSTDSDMENKERSELERLLTKCSSSSKGWKVTEQDESVSSSRKAFTTNWNVTEIEMPKLFRNLSDTELESRKKKRHKSSGSDSEIDKSNARPEEQTRRTLILDKYNNNFGKCVEKTNPAEEETVLTKNGDEKQRTVTTSAQEKLLKTVHVRRLGESNGCNNNSSSSSSRIDDGRGQTVMNDEAQLEQQSEEERAMCEKIGRNVMERSNEIVSSLIQNSHRGYGSATVKSWSGNQSVVEREAEEERKGTKRSHEALYNDALDRGKTKKLKMAEYDKVRDRPRYNLFQERANHQQNMQQQPWRNSSTGRRYNHGYGNQYKRRNFNNRFNGNGNWIHRKRNKFVGHGHGHNYKHYNSYRY